MGVEDMVNKGKDLLGDEEKTDKILDSTRDGANKVTGDKFKDKVQQGRDFIDGHIGDEKK